MTEELERKLASVPLARRALVQNRIRILEDHLQIEQPTVQDADRAAEALGMTRISFYRLLRAWRPAKDPLWVGVQGRPHRRGRRLHAGDSFVERMLASLPEGRPVERDVAAITAAARREGVEVRSHTSLTAMVRELRGPRPAQGLFVDHVVLKVPVQGPLGTTMPTAFVLGDGSTGDVHAVHLSLEVSTKQGVGRLLTYARASGVLTSAAPETITTLAFETDLATDWSPLLGILSRHKVRREGEDRNVPHGGRLGGGLVFPRLLDIETMPRLVGRPLERRRVKVHERLDRILAIEEAQAMIDDRVDAARSDRPAMLSDDVDGLLSDLVRAGLA